MPFCSSSADGTTTPTVPIGRPTQRQTKATPKAAISCSDRIFVPPCANSLMRPHLPKPTDSSARSQFMRSVFDHTCARARLAARRASSSSRDLPPLPFLPLMKSSKKSSTSSPSAIPKRFTCFDFRFRKYSASAASFCSSSGRILVQNSGSSMSTAESSATKAAREKTDPVDESAWSYETRVDEDCRISSISASLNFWKAVSSSFMKMSCAPRLSIASMSPRSWGGPCLPLSLLSLRPSFARSAFIARSRPSFLLARSTISDSYVLRVTSRKTLTLRDWPMRCDRAIACTSFCGFQSESMMMHVSAAVRLMPNPPARVDSRKMKVSEPGLQKRSMAAWRKSPRTVPSRRS
mmetsp:Transcript_22156/g.50026  ORF Transcript_22156/g.50026 Transcript_22156/m.50026 type:complete len:350 (-) Transcript_22156:1216-2265(-)